MLWAHSIARDPSARGYTDLSLSAPEDDDDAALDLLTKTGGARAAVAHAKKVAELTGVRKSA
jgi:hypothetical protein